MAQEIEMQGAEEANYELKPYLSDKDSGMTASLSDGSDTSSASTLLGSEIGNKVDLLDVEKVATEVLGGQGATRASRASLLLWMTLNTVATIAIVRPNLSSNSDQD